MNKMISQKSNQERILWSKSNKQEATGTNLGYERKNQYFIDDKKAIYHYGHINKGIENDETS